MDDPREWIDAVYGERVDHVATATRHVTKEQRQQQQQSLRENRNYNSVNIKKVNDDFDVDLDPMDEKGAPTGDEEHRGGGIREGRRKAISDPVKVTANNNNNNDNPAVASGKTENGDPFPWSVTCFTEILS